MIPPAVMGIPNSASAIRRPRWAVGVAAMNLSHYEGQADGGGGPAGVQALLHRPVVHAEGWRSPAWIPHLVHAAHFAIRRGGARLSRFSTGRTGTLSPDD